MELKTKTTIVQLSGLPLFMPNPLSVQVSFKGQQVNVLLKSSRARV